MKVFVSGCFDMLHSGHVKFLNEASVFGDLYVSVGSDETITELKGRPPLYPAGMRLYMVRNLKCVHRAFIASGFGKLDFHDELKLIKPDVFIVNSDGDSEDKQELCESLGIYYKVLDRAPELGLPDVSTSLLRKQIKMPARIELAGGWLDQPFVRKSQTLGPFLSIMVVTLSIDWQENYMPNRSGLATSTRENAIKLWGDQLPSGDPVKNAEILFRYDNPPGCENISGSQDAIGICVPGLAISYYDKGYWPYEINRSKSIRLFDFLEKYLRLYPIEARPGDLNVLDPQYITPNKVNGLINAVVDFIVALGEQDHIAMGRAMTNQYKLQTSMFPNMRTDKTREAIRKLTKYLHGYKFTGAGGGGYLIGVVKEPHYDAEYKFRIRRD